MQVYSIRVRHRGAETPASSDGWNAADRLGLRTLSVTEDAPLAGGFLSALSRASGWRRAQRVVDSPLFSDRAPTWLPQTIAIYPRIARLAVPFE